jgi:arylamine N-acetyltransferase
MYSSTHVTSALHGDEWKTSHSDRFNSTKDTCYLLNMWMCGPHNFSGCFEVERNLLIGIQTPKLQARSLVALRTTTATTTTTTTTTKFVRTVL